MDTGIKQIVMLLTVFALVSCDKFEMRGFVLSYESADERFIQSMDWNATHPYREIMVADDDYTLFVMGDSHVGGTDNLDVYFENAISENAAAAVMVGDMTSGHAEDFDTFYQHMPGTDDLFTFPIAGNHDLYFHGWKKYRELFGTSTYLFSVITPTAKDLYICLDSGGGTLGKLQLNWLRDVLKEERAEYRKCVIFTHVNLFRIRQTTSTNPNIEELQVLTDLTVRYDVNMMVTAHDHKRNVVELGPTVHITMDALLDDYEYASYLKLNVNDGDLNYEFVELLPSDS